MFFLFKFSPEIQKFVCCQENSTVVEFFLQGDFVENYEAKFARITVKKLTITTRVN